MTKIACAKVWRNNLLGCVVAGSRKEADEHGGHGKIRKEVERYGRRWKDTEGGGKIRKEVERYGRR
ncbi:MAG: hypothetical protein O2954_20880, partial [bacterium]|nr:hypothetical protein [bacterium]